MIVEPLMVGVREHLEVLGAVVVPDAVDVVDLLVRAKRAAELLCRYDSVFQFALTDTRLDLDVAVWTHIPVPGDSLDTAASLVLAGVGAELALAIAKLVPLNVDLYAAVLAPSGLAGSLASGLAVVATSPLPVGAVTLRAVGWGIA